MKKKRQPKPSYLDEVFNVIGWDPDLIQAVDQILEGNEDQREWITQTLQAHVPGSYPLLVVLMGANLHRPHVLHSAFCHLVELLKDSPLLQPFCDHLKFYPNLGMVFLSQSVILQINRTLSPQELEQLRPGAFELFKLYVIASRHAPRKIQNLAARNWDIEKRERAYARAARSLVRQGSGAAQSTPDASPGYSSLMPPELINLYRMYAWEADTNRFPELSSLLAIIGPLTTANGP